MKKKHKTTLKSILSICMILSLLSGIFTGLKLGNFEEVTAATLPPTNILVNGDFEQAPLTKAKTPGSNIITQVGFPGWNTLETDGMLEIWQTGFTPGVPGGISFPSYDGTWFAEINANVASPSSALYQDLTNQVPGTLYQWSFWHMGRSGKDVAMILLGPSNQLNDVKQLSSYIKQYAQPESTSTPVALPTTAVFTNERASDGLTGLSDRYFLSSTKATWTNHWGYWTSSSESVRFLLYSYYSTVTGQNTGLQSVGNLVDGCVSNSDRFRKNNLGKCTAGRVCTRNRWLTECLLCNSQYS